MTQSEVLFRKAIPNDFEGILLLQHENIITNLPDEDLSEGFLSIEFTREQIRNINDELGIFVALQDKKVIGYLMAETVEFAVQSPLIAHMLKRLKDAVFEDRPISSYSLFIYGPVCIDRQRRGQGILEGLFRIMKESLKNHHDVGIAFVSELNPRSLEAHTTKLGMSVIDTFEFEGRRYHTLAFRAI
jgi:predicted N-acetyltransferase YhbS